MLADPVNRLDWTQADEHHWTIEDWSRFITPDEDTGLVYRQPGTELPSYHQLNHLAPPVKRAMQRVVHACLLPLLDRTRPSFPPDAWPRPLPASVNEALRQALSTLDAR